MKINKSIWIKTALLTAWLILSGCSQPTLPPGGFGAQASLEEDTLQVGDTVTLTLTARHPVGSVVTFPTIGKAKEIVLRGRASDTREIADGVLETEAILQLTSFRTGNWTYTPEPATCTFENGDEKSQALPALTLHVESSLETIDLNQMADIRDTLKDPLTLGKILWVAALIIVIALVAGGLALFLMKRPQAALAAAPIIPPHIVALEALARLKQDDWLPEPFFVQISKILRTYLENRFELNAPESTTDELAAKLNHDSRLSLLEQNSLRNFFTQADLVKFAQADAEKEVMNTAFVTVEEFIEQTTETEPEPTDS